MGFPLGYSDLLLPKLLLQVLLLLSSLRHLISHAFTFLGLDDLLLDSHSSWPDNNISTTINYPFPMNIHHQNHLQSSTNSIAASLIQETLPVVRFQDLSSLITDSCAVCLSEFGRDDEVRLLSNCRHVFHKCCLDRWAEHEQRTCPLCRMPLVPEEKRDDFHDRMWAAANDSFATTATEFDSYSSFLISAY